MKRKKNKDRQQGPQSTARPKISQSIWEFAGDFIRIGGTPEDRHNRLNAACSAWNMACNTPELREKHLAHYVRGYGQASPQADAGHLASIRKDMETLIAKTLKMFPNDLRQIIAARIVSEGGKERIEAAAASLQ